MKLFYIFILLFSLVSAGTVKYQNISMPSEDVQTVNYDRAQSFNTAGIDLFNQGQYSSALDRFKQALDAFSRIDHQSGIITVNLNIAMTLNSQGKTNESDLLIEKMRELAAILNLKNSLAECRYRSGSLAAKAGANENAREAFEDALHIYQQLKDIKNTASVLNSLGLVLQNLSNSTEALLRFNQSLAMNKKVKNWRGMSANYVNLGNVYMLTGSLPKALDCAEKSRWLDAQNEDVTHLGISLSLAALVYEKNGRNDMAYLYYRRAYDVNRTIGLTSRLKKDIENIIRTAPPGDAMGQWQKAMADIEISP